MRGTHGAYLATAEARTARDSRSQVQTESVEPVDSMSGSQIQQLLANGGEQPAHLESMEEAGESSGEVEQVVTAGCEAKGKANEIEEDGYFQWQKFPAALTVMTEGTPLSLSLTHTLSLSLPLCLSL